MPDHKAIYAAEGQRYQELISKQPDLSAYINEIRPFSGLDIVDLGAGTGRFTTFLAQKPTRLSRSMHPRRCCKSMRTG